MVALADHMVRLDHVCLGAPVGGSPPVLLFGPDGAGAVCDRLTRCHNANAFEHCASTGSRSLRLLNDKFSLAAVSAGPGAEYPPPGTSRVNRAALFTLTTNVAHDFLEQMVDLFAQQTLGDGGGMVAAGGFFAELLLLPNRRMGASDAYLDALSTPRPGAAMPHSLAMLDALFNESAEAGHRTHTRVVRRGRRGEAGPAVPPRVPRAVCPS